MTTNNGSKEDSDSTNKDNDDSSNGKNHSHCPKNDNTGIIGKKAKKETRSAHSCHILQMLARFLFSFVCKHVSKPSLCCLCLQNTAGVEAGCCSQHKSYRTSRQRNAT